MGLRQLREQALLSRAELAERVGVSRQTLSGWEHGKSQPRMEHIRKLVEALRVEASTLFTALDQDKQMSYAA